MPFFRQKKTNKTKQTKTKLNINRNIKEHNNNTRIYQYHGQGPLQRQKYPKSEQFQPNHSLGDFQQFWWNSRFYKRFPSKWPNFGSGGPFEIFKKRKTIRIEFPKDLARLQTPQTRFRGSKTPRRPRNINKSKNRSFFERFQGSPGSPWSLPKVVIG